MAHTELDLSRIQLPMDDLSLESTVVRFDRVAFDGVDFGDIGTEFVIPTKWRVVDEMVFARVERGRVNLLHRRDIAGRDGQAVQSRSPFM